ncbi:transporter associated domain-containing protein [uncultured Desulfovibrio sp.]|uniref:TerC family protein n=1 Tax=uncultured Desulfovibrio sp. TaxID=167968 RepID=UPI00262DDF61|nr:transporter associated domain-containing protein [uncultured Desulfovibrio sp.]
MWDFSWIADPSAWAGLGTLIVLEVVLGIDNLVFISILTSRLHSQAQRRRAFLTGLGLALLMRLVLLSAIAWIVSLTEPLVTIFGKAFSWRDFILMGGGIFLLLKGTMELHERLEGGMAEYSSAPTRSGFWQVIIQILVLDAVFSLDSIITSVGMVDHIPVMMLAVIVAMAVMVMAAAPLTSFVERHPTVIILCLGFLLMIGLSLLMDGLGYHIPKGYLYAAICFSVLVEICNQMALRNRRKRISMRDMRESMAMAVLGLLGGGRPGEEEARRDAAALASESEGQPLFEPEERDMVARVIRLSGRTARFIMTPRHRVRWLDSGADYATACRFASESLSPWLPVLDPDRDEVLGVIHTGDLAVLTPGATPAGRGASGAAPEKMAAPASGPGMPAAQDGEDAQGWSILPLLRPAPTVFEHASLTEMLETFREEPTPLAFVRDEYGSVVGCITPTDLVSVLAGQMGDMPAGPEACRQPDGSWIMPGRLTVDAVTSWLGIHLPPRSSSATLAGLLLEALGHIPHEGERVRIQGWRMKIVKMDGNRIDQVRVRRLEH